MFFAKDCEFKPNVWRGYWDLERVRDYFRGYFVWGF